MGKRILVQRKGRGGIQFRARDHLKVGPAKYPPLNLDQTVRGVIKEFIHEPGRWTPLAKVQLETGEEFIFIPPEGVYLGKIVEIGSKASLEPGNVLPLSEIPEGTPVCNIELRYGDGGKIARRSGAFATIFSKERGKVILRLPSGKTKVVDEKCRATIGIIAGGGRPEKPLLKAAAAYYKERVHPKRWPRVRGVAMNPVSHPHGGGSHARPGAPTSVSRGAPPGAKVGHIAARKTGRAKKRRGTRRR
ncbi:MAG: 50S ribosomal protein L2 [Thermoproteota archaeon]|nr:MAG: 50S ribosomal protein L2 [Candidatus Korarchaeota archaeon]